MENEFEVTGGETKQWVSPPPKQADWLPTNYLRWKKIPVLQLTSKINAPRSDRVLQQRWIKQEDEEMKEDWRDIPEV